MGESKLTQNQPLSWYKARMILLLSQSVQIAGEIEYALTAVYILQTTFNAPAGNAPLALDMKSMGKGQIWINGQSIGRHWPAYIARGGTCGACNYAGTYTDKKCRTNCGQPSQRW